MQKYEEFLTEQEQKHESLRTIIEGFKAGKWKKILLFSDADPDGITAAAITSRIFQKLNIEFDLIIPHTFELEVWRVEEAFKKKNDYDAVMIIDKGSCGHYTKLLDIVSTVIVIDHHFIQGDMTGCLFFNPGERCSTSHLMHMIATRLGCRGDIVDFYNLIGLRSDWAIRPLLPDISKYVEPFLNEAQDKWSNYFKPLVSRPTWMEIDQREKTLLLNQVSELFFAVTGGGFCYFYNDRDAALKDIDQPRFGYEILINFPDAGVMSKCTTLDEFIEVLPGKDNCKKLYNYYLSDWDKGVTIMSNPAPLRKLGETTIYFFTGYAVPLMPMIGSVEMGDVVQRNGDKKAIFVMCSREKNGWTHFSFRGTDSDIHLGKIAGNLASSLVEKYGHKDEITGGGHPQAAECKIRRSEIPFLHNLNDLIGYFMRLDVLADKDTLSEEEKKESLELGLDYLLNTRREKGE